MYVTRRTQRHVSYKKTVTIKFFSKFVNFLERTKFEIFKAFRIDLFQQSISKKTIDGLGN